MNKPQYQKLAAHHQKAQIVKKQIENIERLLRSMRKKIKEDVRVFRVWVSVKDKYGWSADSEFTAETFKKTILPLLKARLIEFRKQYKAIPPMIIKGE